MQRLIYLPHRWKPRGAASSLQNNITGSRCFRLGSCPHQNPHHHSRSRQPGEKAMFSFSFWHFIHYLEVREALRVISSWFYLYAQMSTKMPEGVNWANVLKCDFFDANHNSRLNDITRWFMKFGAKRTTPVVWTEIQFKFWHWVSTFQATTPQPEPLFIPK